MSVLIGLLTILVIDLFLHIHFQKQPSAHVLQNRCSLKTFAKFIEKYTYMYARVSFLINSRLERCGFIRRETLAQAFFCEYYV